MSRVRGIKITTNKLTLPVVVETLEDKQACVNGLIQAITLRDGSTMWVNEEGKIFGLPFNSIATDVCMMSPGATVPFDPILGDVLVVGPCDKDGNDTHITAEIISDIDRVAREAR